MGRPRWGMIPNRWLSVRVASALLEKKGLAESPSASGSGKVRKRPRAAAAAEMGRSTDAEGDGKVQGLPGLS